MSVASTQAHLAGILVLLALVAAPLITQNTASAQAQTMNIYRGFLRTQGIQIVDADGNMALLRGVNYPGYYECNSRGAYPSLHNEANYGRFASLGFNVVRLPISWAMLEPREGVFDLSYITNYVDKDVQWAKRYGLYIVLDMHQYEWAKKFGGCGVPSWAVRQYPSSDEGMIRSVSNFWINGTLQNHLADVWTRIARIYMNESAIAGYDVLNEPLTYASVIPYLNSTYVYRFYSLVIASIRSVDPNHIIFLEPANMFSSVSSSTVTLGANIVWSPHFYLLAFNSTYSSQAASPLFERDVAAKYKTFVVQLRTPMWIGEFGAFMKDATYQNYLQDAQTLFEKYQLGWAWWGFNSEFGQRVPNVLLSPPLTIPMAATSTPNSETTSVISQSYRSH